jgi:hypothetical protein
MRSLTLLITITAAGSLGVTPELAAQFPLQYQYAAKVVCSSAAARSPLVPQAYATSVNVNNPSDSLIVFIRKRLVITFPPGFQLSQAPLKPMNDSLLQSFALQTDCLDLRRRYGLTQPFFEGFVVVQSTMPVDVTAVYTVPGGVDVVQVAERKVFVTH